MNHSQNLHTDASASQRDVPPIEVVRYRDLIPCFDAFIDTRTPGSDKKENFTIIGPGVSENPDQHVHIPRPHGFNIGGARQPPGCVNSQHSHDTEEVFYVHTGTWKFMLGEHGDDAACILNPGDLISIPTRVFRGFENVGEGDGYLFAVLGGDDPGSVLWAPYVFDMAKDFGLTLLESGMLLDRAKGHALQPGQKPMPATTKAQVEALQHFTDAQLAKCCVSADTSHPWRSLIGPDAPIRWPHGFQVDQWHGASGAHDVGGQCGVPEVVFVHDGALVIETPEGSDTLQRGDTATIRPGLARTYRAVKGSVTALRVRGQAFGAQTP